MAASALHLQAPLCVVVPWMVPLLPSANLCSAVGACLSICLSLCVCVRYNSCTKIVKSKKGADETMMIFYFSKMQPIY